MANAYYEPGSARAERVNALFRSIARRYDRINDVQSFGLHRAWKRRVVELASVGPGRSALDVCCGTGDITELLAARGARATGLDFTAEMLDVARERLRNRHELKCDYVRGDAMALPFADGEFDAVTVGYGLRNLSDWKLGLREMRRVARPGGRLVVIDFGKPDNAPWRTLYFGYLELAVPLFGLVFCGNARAYAYILESLKHFPAQHGVAAELEALGCRDVRTVPLLGGAMAINYAVKT